MSCSGNLIVTGGCIIGPSDSDCGAMTTDACIVGADAGRSCTLLRRIAVPLLVWMVCDRELLSCTTFPYAHSFPRWFGGGFACRRVSRPRVGRDVDLLPCRKCSCSMSSCVQALDTSAESIGCATSNEPHVGSGVRVLRHSILCAGE